jgi:hypothetical protein
MQIGDVFSSADASGSLEYWGVCNFKEFYPDFPKLQALPNHEGPAVELLRQIFSVNPKMRVNQDSEGRIRMVEEDVPTDLLDVKINHLRFPPEYYGPLVAVSVIDHTPEVVAFRMAHNIGPISDWSSGFSLPSEAFAVGKRSVRGNLHDVTVRQALDWVAGVYHGFWMYENCQSPAGGRIVWLGFLENAPSPVRVETHK